MGYTRIGFNEWSAARKKEAIEAETATIGTVVVTHRAAKNICAVCNLVGGRPEGPRGDIDLLRTDLMNTFRITPEAVSNHLHRAMKCESRSIMFKSYHVNPVS
jgi:hypothetical protein